MRNTVKIIFEDEFIIACIKPAGMLSQAAEGESMISVLNEHFAENGEGAQAYPVHRLDRETAGVMVYAKSPEMAAILGTRLQNHEVRKRYYALIKGVPEEKSGTFTDLLFRDKQKNKSFVVKRMRKGVREAVLDYEVLAESNGVTLVAVTLKTGRTHQIRVQFSSRGMPLVGDSRYGGGAGKLALFACRLELRHPKTDEKMLFFALPDTQEYPWNEFDIK